MRNCFIDLSLFQLPLEQRRQPRQLAFLPLGFYRVLPHDLVGLVEDFGRDLGSARGLLVCGLIKDGLGLEGIEAGLLRFSRYRTFASSSFCSIRFSCSSVFEL